MRATWVAVDVAVAAAAGRATLGSSRGLGTVLRACWVGRVELTLSLEWLSRGPVPTITVQPGPPALSKVAVPTAPAPTRLSPLAFRVPPRLSGTRSVRTRFASLKMVLRRLNNKDKTNQIKTLASRGQLF